VTLFLVNVEQYGQYFFKMKNFARFATGIFLIAIFLVLAPSSIGQRTFVNIAESDKGKPQGETRPIRGIYLHSRAISVDNVTDWISVLKEHDFNGVVINVKNVSGEVTYSSDVELAEEMGAETGRLELDKIVKELHKAGIYAIARLTCFKDPVMAARCCGGGLWADPESPLAQEYNISLAQEVATMGFDEIQLDYIRYSDGPGKIGGNYEARSKVIANFVEELRREIPAHVKLSADVYGRTLWKWNSRNIDPIGQNLEYLEEHTDFLSPMIYPSHYQDPDLVYNPRKLVDLSLKSGKERLTVPLRPFIQGFEQAMPSGMDLVEYIKEELRALKKHEEDGFLVWNPRSDYGSLWKAVSGMQAGQ